MKSHRGAQPRITFFAFQDIITSVVGIFLLFIMALVLKIAQAGPEAPQEHSSLGAIPDAVRQLKMDVDRLREEFRSINSRSADSMKSNRINREDRERDRINSIAQVEKQIERTQSLLAACLARSEDQQLRRRKLAEQVGGAEQERQRITDLAAETSKLQSELDQLLLDDPLIFGNSPVENKNLLLVDLGTPDVRVTNAVSGRIETLAANRITTEFEKLQQMQETGTSHFLLLVRPSGVGIFSKVRDLLDARHESYGFELIDAQQKVHLQPKEKATR